MLQNEFKSHLSAGKPLRDMRYLKPVQVPKVYPISRATVYELLASGDIKSVLLKKKHGLRGTRLIDVQSIENFLSKLAKEQAGEAFRPCIVEGDTETARPNAKKPAAQTKKHTGRPAKRKAA
jgi:hypothetical protein